MTILKATKKNINMAARIIRNGGLVVYPTETVYGLGCDPYQVEAVKRLLTTKTKRKTPLPVLAASMTDVENVAYISPKWKKLTAKFWPGSLTLIFSKKPDFPDIVTFGRDTLGLRIPDHHVALQLILLSGGLLVGSSANRTGEKPPQKVTEISKELEELVDIILDGGPTSQGIPSTVIDTTSDPPKILREGSISSKKIMDTLALSN